MQVEKNHSLLHDNTFNIDQKCDEYIVYENEYDAVLIAKDLQAPFLLSMSSYRHMPQQYPIFRVYL